MLAKYIKTNLIFHVLILKLPLEITSHLKSLNIKKATGVPSTFQKFFNCCKTPFHHLSLTCNIMIQKSMYPDSLKLAPQDTPFFKKDYPFIAKIIHISKHFEKNFKWSVKLWSQFETIFNDFLAAFPPKYCCQTTLLRMIDGWKQALDCGDHVAAIVMYLSEASDCLPHDLILLKMGVYGLSVCTLPICL